MERAQQAFARELAVAETEIGFMASTTEAFRAIAHAIDWKSGDEVLVLAEEFPHVVLPWRELEERVDVVEVEPLAGDDRLGALLAALGPMTRVVAVTHVNSFTGTHIDLDVLGAACADAGALLVCDGAQAAGAVPVAAGAADFYVATAYKWLLGGFGSAVVAARSASLARLRPAALGLTDAPSSPRLTYGHLNLPAVYALDAASTLRHAVGLEAIWSRVAELVARIHAGVADLGFQTAAALERSAGIVSLAGIADVPAAVASLQQRGISVADRGGHLRISPYLYTSDADVDEVLLALAELRPAVHSVPAP